MKTNKIAFPLFAIALLIAIIIVATNVRPVSATTMAFAVPRVATSSTIQVGPQNIVTLFATSSACVNRVIGTNGTIMLSFIGSLAPSSTIGHIQATSTSMNYENGDYGCGAITAYSFASTTVTITSVIQ